MAELYVHGKLSRRDIELRTRRAVEIDPAEFKAALEAMRTAGIEIDGLSPDYAIGGLSAP